MKQVYDLRNELLADPESVRKAQELTLDESRPLYGIKGVYGLFGSPDWWANLDNGKIPLKEVCGVISRTYLAGWENDGSDGVDFDLRLEDGSILKESSYFDDPADMRLFKAGAKVKFVYVLEVLKNGEVYECPLRVFVDECSTPTVGGSA